MFRTQKKGKINTSSEYFLLRVQFYIPPDILIYLKLNIMGMVK